MGKNKKIQIEPGEAEAKAVEVKVKKADEKPAESLEKLSDMQVLMRGIVERLKEAKIDVNTDKGARVVIKKEYYDCEMMLPNILSRDDNFSFAIRMDAVIEKGVYTIYGLEQFKLKVRATMMKEPFKVRNLNVIAGAMVFPADDELKAGTRTSVMTFAMYATKGVI